MNDPWLNDNSTEAERARENLAEAELSGETEQRLAVLRARVRQAER